MRHWDRMRVIASSAASENFVDIDVGAGAWVLLAVIVVTRLGIDLYRHREAHAPTPRQALLESTFWVACGLGFSIVILVMYGGAAFGEYTSGYLIEKSLSVDNVFVWSMLFTTLSIPLMYQHRVLFWGIFGALTLRLVFILLGSALISQFWWTLVIFGAFLVYTGIKVLRHRADEGQDESTRGLHLLRRVMPVTDDLDGQRFFTRLNAKRAATPLFAALVVIELTDIVFAVDSVPAILAVSRETYIVFASNAFAILGLRAMYFLLANARERFHYLAHGLGAILIFVGLKMAVSHWFHMNTYVSLAIITTMLGLAIVFSVRKNRQLEIAGLIEPVEHHRH
jgi:tellurite resistance protein TerC